MATTLAALRLMVLIAWCFYALFEDSPKKLMYVLVFLLMIPNAVGVYVGIFGL